MKTILTLIPAGVLFLASSVVASAQLMHVSYFGHVTAAAPGANWFAPGEPVLGETPVWIDVTFNPDLPADPRNPANAGRLFLPENDPVGPEGYTFRVRFGNIDLTRPISSLEVIEDGSFGIESFGEGHELSLQVFLAAPSPDLPLPRFMPENVTGNAGIVLFDNLPHDPPLGYGVVLARIDGLSAVPEPSTYGLLASVAIGGAILLRRRLPRPTTL